MTAKQIKGSTAPDGSQYITLTDGAGNLVAIGGDSGDGTVTSVAVTTAHGISGTVANPTTTPAISLTLGAITPTTVNGNTLTTGTGTLTLGAGKTATISNTLTVTATDGSTLVVGTGGTLGTNAYTSTAYAPIASPTFTGTVTTPNLVASTGIIKLASFTVATLPSASSSGAGATAFVTDASTTFALSLGLTVLGSGSNKVPVYSDGTNWIVG